MSNNNPLYAIAAEKHKEDLQDGDFEGMANTPANKAVYTLGFCRGVSYAADFHAKKIQELQKIVNELTQSKNES